MERTFFSLAGALICLILIATFIADLFIPLGYAVWSPYLLAVMLARHCGSVRTVLGVALVAIVLTMLDLAIGVPGELVPGILNRLFGVCLIALAGAITSIQVRGERVLARANAERHEAETQLRSSEQRFRAFMDHGPALAWMKDAEGRYVFLSASFERRFGRRSEEACGKTDFDLWPIEKANTYRQNDLAVLNGNESLELVEPGPQGEMSGWWVIRFPFEDASGGRFVGGVALDISPRIRAEEAKNELIAKLQGALQEIKTLRGLIPICSYCKKIRDDAGFWQQLEKYLVAHTDAQFTHGICPVCFDEQLGPEYRPVQQS